MPFAAPPCVNFFCFLRVISDHKSCLSKSIGNLRFAPPQPPLSFQGVRQATSFGAACFQQSPGTAQILGTNVSSTLPQPPVVSEDCQLCLSSWLLGSIINGVFRSLHQHNNASTNSHRNDTPRCVCRLSYQRALFPSTKPFISGFTVASGVVSMTHYNFTIFQVVFRLVTVLQTQAIRLWLGQLHWVSRWSMCQRTIASMVRQVHSREQYSTVHLWPITAFGFLQGKEAMAASLGNIGLRDRRWTEGGRR